MKDTRVSRRTMIVGGGVVTTLFAAALGLTLPRLFAHRYAPTRYDDLLSKLVARDEAARVGAAVRIAEPNFDTRAAARELRQRFEQRNLAEVSDADIREGRVVEVNGWVMPESLAQLCRLAAE
jgi:hypothetical protein